MMNSNILMFFISCYASIDAEVLVLDEGFHEQILLSTKKTFINFETFNKIFVIIN